MAGMRPARHGGIRRIAFIGVLSTVATSSAATAQDRSFTVYNASDVALESVYVSPIYSKYWGSDLLSSTLGPGQTRQIQMNGFGRYCFFDLRCNDANGREIKLWAEDLCNSDRVEIR